VNTHFSISVVNVVRRFTLKALIKVGLNPTQSFFVVVVFNVTVEIVFMFGNSAL
jgi:hypothetical protein